MCPSVYIILVNYCGKKDTVECIESIHNMCTYPNYKIIVVDNSPNNDINNLNSASLSSIILIKSDNNGFAAGCNLGIKRALYEKADYILLLNNDTTVKSPDLIEQLLKGFKGNVGMVGGKIYYYTSPDLVWYEAGYLSPIRLRAKNRKKQGINNVTFITGCMQMIKADVFKHVGYINEDYFLTYEDADYCIQLIKKGYKLVYNSTAQIYHKVGRSNQPGTASSIYYSNRARYIFLKKYHQCNILALIDYHIELLIKLLLYRGAKKQAIKQVYQVIRKKRCP
ncbi:MAG: glycosyltransferase family 2 protein [Clostridium sp.]|nr:glycosyltransferase family 2 protein [Ruminococcus flavefaciens]MCM1499469.1 glycosyltransferase family 2 protein [Clostridium sp.]